MINRRASRSSGKWSRRSARATKTRLRARSIWKAIEALAELIADNDEGEGCYGVMGTDSDDSDAFKLQGDRAGRPSQRNRRKRYPRLGASDTGRGV